MPAKIERDIKKSVRKAHPGASEKRATGEAFAIMNKQGLVRGNKITAKGKRAESRYEVVHHAD